MFEIVAQTLEGNLTQNEECPQNNIIPRILATEVQSQRCYPFFCDHS